MELNIDLTMSLRFRFRHIAPPFSSHECFVTGAPRMRRKDTRRESESSFSQLACFVRAPPTTLAPVGSPLQCHVRGAFVPLRIFKISARCCPEMDKLNGRRWYSNHEVASQGPSLGIQGFHFNSSSYFQQFHLVPIIIPFLPPLFQIPLFYFLNHQFTYPQFPLFHLTLLYSFPSIFPPFHFIQFCLVNQFSEPVARQRMVESSYSNTSCTVFSCLIISNHFFITAPI